MEVVSPNKKISMAPSDYKVAIFSAEFGVKNEWPTYSGGMGILAGDWLKEAADRGWPILGLGIGYHKGYFNQVIGDDGRQRESDANFNPAKHGFELLPEREITYISGRPVKVALWEKFIEGKRSSVPLYFITTNLPENTEWDKGLTARLYDDGNGSRDYYKTAQYRILATGVRLLQRRSYDITTYHLNDGHGAFVVLELLNQGLTPEKVREKIWFTTHTSEQSAFEYFDIDQVRYAIGDEVSKILTFAVRDGKIGMADLAIALSRGINAVSPMHAYVSSKMPQFEGKEIIAITNGIHLPSWVHEAKAALYESQFNKPFENPEEFNRADLLDYSLFREAHRIAQKDLFRLVKEKTTFDLDLEKLTLDIDKLTLGFARRVVTYKRADLLLHDLERLAKVVNGNAQIIFAGKAPPNDAGGKEMIQRVYQRAVELRQRYDTNIVYVPNYDMEVGSALVSGVDLWINNPIRGREASGTSGMKVATNGGVNMSVLDGWWLEGYTARNGFAIAPNNLDNDRETDFRSILSLLENEVIPAYNGHSWQQIALESMKLASYFNTFRNLGEYAKKGAHNYSLEQRLMERVELAA